MKRILIIFFVVEGQGYRVQRVEGTHYNYH